MATMESLTGLVNRIQRACTVLGEVKACLSGKLSRPLLLLVARVLENLQSWKALLAEILPRGSGSGSEYADLKRKLTHSIPTSLGSAQIPRSLHLQRNSFQGQLPASLTKPRYLETLDLGENAFTGPIPSWIGEKFDGEIPLPPHSTSR